MQEEASNGSQSKAPDNTDSPQVPSQAIGENKPPTSLIWPRLLIGWIVLIAAEVFSGASLPAGLWHPWTILVTYFSEPKGSVP